jgi:hypothetical protein
VTEDLPDDSKLTSDIEEIWQHLADARGDVAREREEAAERTAEIEAIGENLRRYAEKRKKQIADRRRPRRAADGQ